MDTNALALLFERMLVGAYIGTIGPDGETTTIAANPHLRVIFGFPADAPAGEVLPFRPDRFAEPHARETFVARLAQDGGASDYLLRMRRCDETPVWIEITATAEMVTDDGGRTRSGERSGGARSGGTSVPPVLSERERVGVGERERVEGPIPPGMIRIEALIRDVSDRKKLDD